MAEYQLLEPPTDGISSVTFSYGEGSNSLAVASWDGVSLFGLYDQCGSCDGAMDLGFYFVNIVFVAWCC